MIFLIDISFLTRQFLDISRAKFSLAYYVFCAWNWHLHSTYR